MMRHAPTPFSPVWIASACVAWLLSAGAAFAQNAGEVEFARGVGFAQSEGQIPRTMGKGLQLKEGDRLTTSEGSSAIIKMQDGTRMTVRPNSEIVIQQFQFKENAPDNSMVMGLLRGGFRAITGLISKSNVNAARVVTNTATIGIRGTDFDARLCISECKAESAKSSETPKVNSVQASAKLVVALGEIHSVDSAGVRHLLTVGGSLYPGDTLETSKGASAVLAFRDDSRMTVGSASQFRVDSFVFDDQNPKEGRFLVSLLRGSMRALTGLIGKANNRNVAFKTSTATIGIRGTGLDLDCNASGSCSFFTWLGTIEVTPLGQSALQVLQAGQGLFVTPTSIRPMAAPTLQDLPRPDTVPVDTKQLFVATPVEEGKEGLFVFVRDGHIEVTSTTGEKQTLHLGKGETGYAGEDGRTARPLVMPLFIQGDRTPLPNSKNPMLESVLGETVKRSTNRCDS